MSRTAARITLSAALLSGLSPLLAAPASAAGASESISIVSTVDFATGSETFVAEGGGLCRSGTAFVSNGPYIRERGVSTFLLNKGFTCDDGSGTFFVELRVWYSPCAATDRGVWTVLGGTGAYASLKGQGQVVGTYTPGPCSDATGLVDHYTGRLS